MAARTRVFASRGLPGDSLERLRGQVEELTIWPGPGAPGPGDLGRAASGSEGLLCLLTDRIDRGLLEAAPTLRVVSSCSVGVDHVDLAAATEGGIPVGHTPGVLTETTADLTLALLLAAARRLPEADAFLRDGSWTWERRWEPDLLLGRDLHGATLGIVGYGAIGRAVARRARGFGMRILAWSRSASAEEGVEPVSFDDLLRQSDFVSVHLPLTSETRGLLGEEAIRSMRRGAILVNTARGGIVDETALAAALSDGHLAAAGLDVFEQEPLEVESSLRALPNAVLTPHVGSASIATRTRMADLSVENLLAGLEGRRLPHCANPEVYGA